MRLRFLHITMDIQQLQPHIAGSTRHRHELTAQPVDVLANLAVAFIEPVRSIAVGAVFRLIPRQGRAKLYDVLMDCRSQCSKPTAAQSADASVSHAPAPEEFTGAPTSPTAMANRTAIASALRVAVLDWSLR